MTEIEFAQPYQGDDTPAQLPAWITHMVVHALTRDETGFKDVRNSLPDDVVWMFDNAVEVQKWENANRRSQEVQREKERRSIQREAERLVKAEENVSQKKPVYRTLREEMALPDEPVQYAINELLPIGGNALFAGQYKAGKTTVNNNLIHAWADNELFLGRFRCNPPEDKPDIAIFNYEVTEGQFRRWLRGFDIQNLDRVHILHLRGASLPLAFPERRKEIAKWLKEKNIGLWIVDPASRAMLGMDGDNNGDVNVFTSWLDEIKAEAEVPNLVLNIHMSHAAAADKNAERAMGAQAWSAWADSLWMLTSTEKDGEKERWFRAYGRDVNEGKRLLDYDDDTMAVSLLDVNEQGTPLDGGDGGPGHLETELLRTLLLSGGGLTGAAVERELRAAGVQGRAETVREALAALVAWNLVTVLPGPRNARLHYANKITIQGDDRFAHLMPDAGDTDG